jgi:hypothetical protein
MKKTLRTLATGMVMMASVSAFAADAPDNNQAKMGYENTYTYSSKGGSAFNVDFAKHAQNAVCSVMGPLGLLGCPKQ